MKMTRISLSVTTDNEEIMTRAIEAFVRVGAGLAMEGIGFIVFCGEEEEVEEDSE